MIAATDSVRQDLGMKPSVSILSPNNVPDADLKALVDRVLAAK